jgi:hypothetical protein
LYQIQCGVWISKRITAVPDIRRHARRCFGRFIVGASRTKLHGGLFVPGFPKTVGFIVDSVWSLGARVDLRILYLADAMRFQERHPRPCESHVRVNGTLASPIVTQHAAYEPLR